MQSNYSRAAGFHCLRIVPASFGMLVLASMLCLSPRAASATSGGLDLRQAIEKTLAQNKQLAAFGYRLAEHDGRLQQARLLPNPELDLEFENMAGEGKFEDYDNAETTLSLSWLIEPGLRGRRVGVAQAHSDRISLDAEILQLDVAAQTAQRFLSCLESQAHLKDMEKSVALAERTVAAVERRVNAGRAPKADLMRARAGLATEQLAHDDVTHEQSVAHYRLAAQWGEIAPSFSHVEGVLLDLPSVASFEDFAARLEKNPELERLVSEQRIAEAKLQYAKADRWPSLKPYLGARRFETTNDWSMVAGLSVPIPIFDRNQGKVAESRAVLEYSRADADAERIRAHTTLFEVYQEMQHSVHRAEVLRDEVIPRFEATIEGTRQGYEKGRYPYSELRLVSADLLAAKRSLVEASTAAHRLVITLERLTGERMTR